MANAILGSQNFSGGWVTALPAHLIEDGATPNVQNVDFSESFGRLTKRKGHSNYIAANVTNIPVTGLYQFITNAGVEHLVASSNDDVYNISAPSTWTSIHNNASLNSANVNFATYNNLCIFVSVNLTTQKWTGSGSSSALGGSPPSNAQFIDTHKRRVFIANTSAGVNRLHYSALDNPEDWTTANDAGYIDIGLGDGDHITGIASLGTALMIFKKRSTWALYGSGPSNFSVRQVSPSVGCAAPKSIVKADKFCIFLSYDGVYSVNSDGVALLSYNIKPTIDAITTTARPLCAAGRLFTQYWLAVDTDADGKNDEVYVLDYLYGVWGRYTNKKENVFYRLVDGTLLSGGSDTDVIRKHNDTDNDAGSAITATWDTKDYDADDWTKKKRLMDVIISAYPISGKTITVSHLLDGVVQGTTISMSLTASGSQDKVYLVGRHLPDTSYAGWIRFRLTNAETDARIRVFGYSIAVNALERQNG